LWHLYGLGIVEIGAISQFPEVINQPNN